MPWPTWDQAALAAVLSVALWWALRRVRSELTRPLEPVAAEFALVSSLYAVWRLARMLPLTADAGAMDRARDIVTAEHWLRLPTELSLQQFVLRHEWLGEPTSLYYATLHVPALIAFLVWLFFRHRDRYPHWRNGLALVTAGCLVIRFVRVAPPRFFPDLGYQDLSHHYGVSVYGSDVTIGVSDQFAAMPSIHVAWAAVVSFGVVAVSTSRWRWLFLLHVVTTTLVVAATANHWWLDGIVAVLLLWGGLVIDTAVRSLLARRRGAPPALEVEPAPAYAEER
ncbi:MAG: inositol phosphorylceramide synthase [Nocardioides sp.]|nr:inositol phosphorylceramide synthase [Nocardioides sp.]